MKEKVTFKSFFSTICRGIVQVFQWILNALGLMEINGDKVIEPEKRFLKA